MGLYYVCTPETLNPTYFVQLMKRSTSCSRWIRMFSSSSLFGAGQPCDYSTNSPRLPCVACGISSSWVSSQLALFFLSFFLVALPLPLPLLACCLLWAFLTVVCCLLTAVLLWVEELLQFRSSSKSVYPRGSVFWTFEREFCIGEFFFWWFRV